MEKPEEMHDHGGLDELHVELDTTPVHAAARAGQVDELRAILDADASQAAALDKYGLTPLHWACDRGEAAAAELLLRYSAAEVNAVEKRMFRRRPVHFAALAGDERTVRALLAHDADLQATDYRGWTALHGAAHSGSVATVTALLTAPKTDVKALLALEAADGATAAQVADRTGHGHLASQLRNWS